jgi:hypothetical protein
MVRLAQQPAASVAFHNVLSATVTRLMSPGMVCLSAEAALHFEIQEPAEGLS